MSLFDEYDSDVIDLDTLTPEQADAAINEAVSEFIEATDDSIDSHAFKAFFEASGYDWAEAMTLYDHWEGDEPDPEVESDEFEQFAEENPEAAADPVFIAALEHADDDLDAAVSLYNGWVEEQNAVQQAAVDKILPRRGVSLDDAVDAAYDDGAFFGNAIKPYRSQRSTRDDALTSAINDMADAKGTDNAIRKLAEADVRRSVDE